MQCEDFQSRLADYLAEKLDEDRRSQFRQHFRECPGCRNLALAEEPTLLFMLSSSVDGDNHEAVDDCVAAVARMIRQDRLVERLERRRQPWRYAAAAAAVIALSLGAWWLGGGGDGAPIENLVAQDDEVDQSPKVEFEMDGDGVRIYRLANDEEAAVWFVVNPELES